MTDQPKILKSEGWLTLRPTYAGGEPTGFKIEKLTTKRPSTNQPVMKVTLAIPAAAFARFAPAITVEVPDGFAFPEPTVTVEPEPEAPR